MPQMPKAKIPVHHLPPLGAASVRVEHIRAADHVVHNDVHRHDFHELFFFATGQGEHMIDLEAVPVAPPCVHLVAPGQVHQLTRSGTTRGTVVMFGEGAWMELARWSEVAALFESGTRIPAFTLDPAALAEAEDLLRRIEQEVGRGRERSDGVVLNYLGILLLRTARWRRPVIAQAAPATDRNGTVEQFLRAVDAHFLEHLPVGTYAERLALSPGRLNALVRKHTGKSAGEVLQDRLLLEAKRLLLHADLSVKEVSYALHMGDPAYFNRFFKKAVGTTPLTYREQVRGKYQR